MPITMIAAGIARVHQKSGEFLLKVELSELVVVFICLGLRFLDLFGGEVTRPTEVGQQPWFRWLPSQLLTGASA